MYSEADIQSAVEAGIMTPETAAALRAHVAAKRQMRLADEEHFLVLGGFNDIFVTLALLLVLVFPISIGNGYVAAAVCWGIAEFVTRRRRLALPSIVLLLIFTPAVYLEALASLGAPGREWLEAGSPDAAIGACAAAFLATLAYWWRFRVPIAQAAMAATVLAALVQSVAAQLPNSGLTWPLLGFGGVAIFAYAMWWDLSDRERRTHRADVAFWLHLLAAPLIAHSVFRHFGLFGAATMEWAPIVLLIYLIFSLVAIVVDRRAILVSGLGYALAAVTGILGDVGAGILGATLLLGGTLLMLGLFWSNVRAAVVVHIPEDWRRRLPPIDRRTA
ncbi:MAG TPA: hypothetical protein VF603_07340 [Allosphingosinicella sp.]|jgi:hypothetical protein